MFLHRTLLGKTGEDLACRELRRRGYEILARRYRTRVGELDIVARDGTVLVFVEVKARATGQYGTPAEAVTPRKQQKICAMAADYLCRHQLTASPCRFDVVTVAVGERRRPAVTVIPGAFDLKTL